MPATLSPITTKWRGHEVLGLDMGESSDGEMGIFLPPLTYWVEAEGDRSRPTLAFMTRLPYNHFPRVDYHFDAVDSEP